MSRRRRIFLSVLAVLAAWVFTMCGVASWLQFTGLSTTVRGMVYFGVVVVVATVLIRRIGR